MGNNQGKTQQHCDMEPSQENTKVRDNIYYISRYTNTSSRKIIPRDHEETKTIKKTGEVRGPRNLYFRIE